MKIGILTYHFAINYGAVIQAWALSRHLADLGHDVHVINYDPVKGRLPWWARLLYHGRWQMLVRTMKFRLFRRSRLRETVTVDDVHDIERLALDAVVVGSDQVWNVDFFKESDGHFNRVYLLCGLSSSVKSIAYAASMCEVLPGGYPWREEFSAALRRFDSVSVREQFACNELLKLGIAAQRVVDPTLLVSDDAYDLIARKKEDVGPYLFSYLLTELDRGLWLCGQYQEAKGCPLELVTLRDVNCQRRANPSPAKFLSLLRNAQFVITDSFHGVALSVVFNVPFAVLLKRTAPGQDARIEELLDGVGLSDRIISCRQDAVEVFSRGIDWTAVNARVRAWQALSRAWLRKSLGECADHKKGNGF